VVLLVGSAQLLLSHIALARHLVQLYIEMLNEATCRRRQLVVNLARVHAIAEHVQLLLLEIRTANEVLGVAVVNAADGFLLKYGELLDLLLGAVELFGLETELHHFP